jgi:hypothetical protein
MGGKSEESGGGAWRYLEVEEIVARGVSVNAARFAAFVQARFYSVGETFASHGYLGELWHAGRSKVSGYVRELVAAGVWRRRDIDGRRFAVVFWRRTGSAPDPIVDVNRVRFEPDRVRSGPTSGPLRTTEGEGRREEPHLRAAEEAIALVAELGVGAPRRQQTVEAVASFLAQAKDPEAEAGRLRERARAARTPAGWLVEAARGGFLDAATTSAAAPPGPADTSGPSARMPFEPLGLGLWDYDLERAVAWALGADARRRGAARREMTGRFGSVDAALARFEALVVKAPDLVPGSIVDGGVAAWRAALPGLRARLEEARA